MKTYILVRLPVPSTPASVRRYDVGRALGALYAERSLLVDLDYSLGLEPRVCDLRALDRFGRAIPDGACGAACGVFARVVIVGSVDEAVILTRSHSLLSHDVLRRAQVVQLGHTIVDGGSHAFGTGSFADSLEKRQVLRMIKDRAVA